MSHRSITYADFTAQRTIAAPIKKVYEAFADSKAKEKWFKGPTDDGTTKHTMDFRIGGSEVNQGTFHDGIMHTFKAIYYDIVPNERIVYTYEMYLQETRISVSLATIELHANGDATHVSLHEQGAFLDGLDKPENREFGTQELLKTLEASLIKE